MATNLTILENLVKEKEKLLNTQAYNVKVGKIIRKYRQTYNLSQTQFAELLNMSRNRLVQIENGTSSITAYELHLIKYLFKIPEKELEFDKYANDCIDRDEPIYEDYEYKTFSYLHSLNLSKDFFKLLIQFVKQSVMEGKN